MTLPEPFSTGAFHGHSLETQSQAALMNRMDSKFMLPLGDLAHCLSGLEGNYSMLEMQGLRWFSYDTLYFDTPDLHFYHDHHNGKLNRYKVRTRHYRDSNTAFLEIKFKNNQKRTIKTRIELDQDHFQAAEILSFAKNRLGQSVAGMRPTIFVHYRRATLMSADSRERVTLDVDLQFRTADHRLLIDLPGIALVEVKCDRKHGDSAITRALKHRGLRPVSFSKYCIGTGLLRTSQVKTNRFKPLLSRLEKLAQYQAVNRAQRLISLATVQTSRPPVPNIATSPTGTSPNGTSPNTTPALSTEQPELICNRQGQPNRHDLNKNKGAIWNQQLTSIFSSGY